MSQDEERARVVRPKVSGCPESELGQHGVVAGHILPWEPPRITRGKGTSQSFALTQLFAVSQ
jgi:hypothetical protein